MLPRMMGQHYAQHVEDLRLLRESYKKRIKAAESKEEQLELKAELGETQQQKIDEYNAKFK